MPFQLTRAGLQAPAAAEARAWREQYAERSCVTLPGFIEPALIRRLQTRIAAAAWEEHVHDADPPSTDLLLIDPVLDGVLAALIQDPGLFDIVRAITGCDAIGSFAGRIYRLDPDRDHHHAWHGDDDPGDGLNNRMATLSVNLSTGIYAGGVLELRRRGSDRLLHRVANTGAGDAILFRIDHALEHRVTDVEGTVPKIAWAGWFQREPRIDLGRLVRSSGAW
jgi:2-oxoglutarate-Fe(II)-dependent oxygenase superfamily protein